MFKLLFYFMLLIFSNKALAEALVLITPYSVGGPSDIIARNMEISIERFTNLSVAVINKPGASGNIGFKEFVDRKGKVLLLGHENIVTNATHLPSSYPKEILNIAKPIYFIKGGSYIVYGNIKFENFKNLISYSKDNFVMVGASSPGSGSFLGYEQLCNIILLKCRVVIYPSVGTAVTDMLSNRLDMYVSLYSAHNNFTALKTNIPLLVLSENKFFALPDVLTSKELGINVFIDNWAGIFQKNLSDNEINLIKDAAKKYFVNSKLNELGYDQIDFDENFVNEKYKKF